MRSSLPINRWCADNLSNKQHYASFAFTNSFLLWSSLLSENGQAVFSGLLRIRSRKLVEERMNLATNNGGMFGLLCVWWCGFVGYMLHHYHFKKPNTKYQLFTAVKCAVIWAYWCLWEPVVAELNTNCIW